MWVTGVMGYVPPVSSEFRLGVSRSHLAVRSFDDLCVKYRLFSVTYLYYSTIVQLYTVQYSNK